MALSQLGVTQQPSPAPRPPVLHSVPGSQDALVGLQLAQEAWVGAGDGPELLHVAQSLLQAPAVLLHGISYHRGRRAADTHLAVDQHSGALCSVEAGQG